MGTARSGCHEILLNSQRRTAIFCIVIGSIAALQGYELLRLSVANYLGQSTDIQKVEYALGLDPLNPELENHLGDLYLFQKDASIAVSHYKRAVLLNRRAPDYWSSLAWGCMVTDDLACAETSLKEAVVQAPYVSRHRWDLANYYLVAGRDDEAFQRFGEVLRLRPDLSFEIFQVCLRGHRDPETIWRVLLANASAGSKIDFLRLLSALGKYDVSDHLWTDLFSHEPKIPVTELRPYLEDLISANRLAQALVVWNDMKMAGTLAGMSPAPELVQNGGFEEEFLDTGFSWRRIPQRFIALSRDRAVVHEGSWSLKVEFTAPNNEEYEPISEFIPVQPNKKYRLRAFVRSEDLSSSVGPRLRVIDPECPSCVTGETEATTGTSDWHEVGTTIDAGPSTRFLRLSLWRPKSRTYPMDIEGKFWVDSISMTQIEK